MSGTGNLALRARPRRAELVVGVVLFLAAIAVVIGRSGSPEPLPLSDTVINVRTPVDQPVYLGVFTPGNDWTRKLRLDGVKVHATSNTELTITPLLCHGGSISVTTDPEKFCDDLVDPEGETLGAGDSIVLQVVCDEPTVAVIDPVRLGFHEGFKWGTLPAGAGSIVQTVGT